MGNMHRNQGKCTSATYSRIQSSVIRVRSLKRDWNRELGLLNSYRSIEAQLGCVHLDRQGSARVGDWLPIIMTRLAITSAAHA